MVDISFKQQTTHPRLPLCAAAALLMATTRLLAGCRFTIALLFLIGATLTAATSPTPFKSDTVRIAEQDGIGYLLRAGYAQIERFDIATRQFLSPLPLPVTANYFVVDGDAIFFATDQAVGRIDLTGDNFTHVANLNFGPIDLLGIDGDLLIVSTNAGLGHMLVIDKETFAIAASFHSKTRPDPTLVPSLGWVIGTGSSFDRPYRFTYRADSLEHQLVSLPDFPRFFPGKIILFPDQRKVIHPSGEIRNLPDFSVHTRIEAPFDHIIFHGDDVLITAIGNHLIAYSNTFIETGRYTLSHTPLALLHDDDEIIAFQSDEAAPSGFSHVAVDLDTIGVNPPGLPISGYGLLFQVQGAVMDNDGILHILNKDYARVFRWDTTTQTYLSSIALPETPELITFSSQLNRLYISTFVGEIYAVDLNAAEPEAALHATTDKKPTALLSLGSDLLASVESAAGDNWVFAADGNLIATPVLDNRELRLYFPDQALLYLNALVSKTSFEKEPPMR